MPAFGLRRLGTTVLSIPRPHTALAHSTWFHVPEQGMAKHEVLAQGSAFLTRAPGGGLFGLLSAHVAAPHRWRRYFAADFLDHVNDSHCESRLHRRSASGRGEILETLMVAQLSDGFAEAQLDVAAFRVHDQGNSPVLELLDGSVPQNATVSIHGHVLRGENGADGVIPTAVDGKVVATDGPRVFVNTGNDECEMGMCGGPVILKNGICAGILEGVVPRIKEGSSPLSELHERIAGSAAFISAKELRLFLADVEKAMQTAHDGAERKRVGIVGPHTSDAN